MSVDGRPEKPGQPGRLRRWLGRARPGATAGPDLAPEERPAEAGCVRIGDCGEGPQGRPVVRVAGTLTSVGEHSVAGLPALRAELDDGSASLTLVWLGRTAIRGIEPGRRLVAAGRIAVTRGRPVLFNPRYELRPRPAAGAPAAGDGPGRTGVAR
jgi:hypothetical protein